MKSEDRRQSILAAATTVFGDYGYAGATTDQVARAAGVSQPYVVRMFGTKENLFLEVLHRALEHLLGAFEATLSEAKLAEATIEKGHPAEGTLDLGERLGRAYVDLVNDRGMLLLLMNSFAMGSDPVIGKAAREGFLRVYEFLRNSAGFDAEEVQVFLANGMLINTMVGLRMSDDFDANPLAAECLTTALPHKLDIVLDLGKSQRAERA